MLNEALRLIRVYHDLSQTELRAGLGVSHSHISEIESGKKQPSLDLLQKYSDFFEVPLSSLLFFAENIHDPKITDKVRAVMAKKIVALLQWVDQKNDKNTASLDARSPK